MSEDCRNDCALPPDFPREIYNRPGLDHIQYRIGSFSDMFAAILDGVNKDPALQGWTHHTADDPGIALLESAAIVGDILTFYQELYANEAFLSTARWRESIGDLVRLLGYRLAPGLGGRALFAFTLRGDQAVKIPAGFPVKAQVTGLEDPADFETVSEAEALPALGKFNLYRPFIYPGFTSVVSVFSTPTAALEAAGIKLEVKDRLMLLDTTTSPTNNAQIVIVKKVDTSFERTHITIEGSWTKGAGLSQVRAYKLGRTFRHFGHNAPPQVVVINGTTPALRSITYTRQLHAFTYTTGDTTIDPGFAATEIPLDKEVAGLAVGNKIILQGVAFHDATLLRQVTRFRSTSQTWGALTGATTLISLDSEWDDLRFGHTHSGTDIRQLVIHETVGVGLTLTAVRQADPAADGASLEYFGDSASYAKLKERRLALLKPDATLLETTANIDPQAAQDGAGISFRKVYLSPPLGQGFGLDDFPFENPPVSVYGNLVEANQGKTESLTVLGSGDNRQSFQTFKLPKSPLTYLNRSGETPPQVPELQVYVDDRLWQRVPSLFGHSPNEEIYAVREDALGDSWVQFGDGQTGKQLPSGVDNISARFRTGSGAYGGLKPETTVQAGSRLDHLDKVFLPGIATGGQAPESGENARQAAPGKVQSLDRLVSLQDFESEAQAIPGISRVKAAWSLVDNLPGVVVTVLMDTGRGQEINQVRQILATFNRCRGPQRFPIHVIQGKRLYVAVKADVAFDPTYRQELVIQAIQEALGAVTDSPDQPARGLFSLGQRTFGEVEYATRLAAIIQNVAGVRWTKIREFFPLGEADDPASLALPDVGWLEAVVACDASHILSLYPAQLQLKPVSIPSPEVC